MRALHSPALHCSDEPLANKLLTACGVPQCQPICLVLLLGGGGQPDWPEAADPSWHASVPQMHARLLQPWVAVLWQPQEEGASLNLQTLIIQPKKRKCNPALPPKASRLGSTNSAMAKRRTDTTGAADNCRAGPNGNTELIESCSSDNSLHHCRIVTIEGRKSEKIRTLEL